MRNRMLTARVSIFQTDHCRYTPSMIHSKKPAKMAPYAKSSNFQADNQQPHPDFSHKKTVLRSITDADSGIFFNNDPILSRPSEKEAALSRAIYLAGDNDRIAPWHESAVNEQIIQDAIFRFELDLKENIAKNDLLNKIKKASAEISIDLPAMNKRRAHEHALADYIKRVIEPGGVIDINKKNTHLSVDPFEIAEKLYKCRGKVYVGLDTKRNSKVFLYPDKCGFGKLCPDEARVESERLKEKYIPAVLEFLQAKKGNTFQSWVLTGENVPGKSLLEMKQKMFADFSRLLKTKKMRNIKGALVIQEDPLAKDGLFNVHLNVIVLARGKIDWKAIRRSWGKMINFDSAKDCRNKTIKKLKKKGKDISSLGNEAVLVHAFSEICKYATKTVSEKSAEKLGLSQAPAMVDWSGESWRQWFAANHGFRRTRSYGVLFDPAGFMWDSASEFTRSRWLRKAEFDLSLSACAWRKGDNSLDRSQREVLKDIILGIERSSLKFVKWFAVGAYCQRRGYLFSINLIQGDKFVFSGSKNGGEGADLSTGPPASDGFPVNHGETAAIADDWDSGFDLMGRNY